MHAYVLGIRAPVGTAAVLFASVRVPESDYLCYYFYILSEYYASTNTVRYKHSGVQRPCMAWLAAY